MTDEELLDKFRKEVCEKSAEIDPDEEYDWTSLSIGFFAAFGITEERAQELAAKARYTHQYWM